MDQPLHPYISGGRTFTLAQNPVRILVFQFNLHTANGLFYWSLLDFYCPSLVPNFATMCSLAPSKQIASSVPLCVSLMKAIVSSYFKRRLRN